MANRRCHLRPLVAAEDAAVWVCTDCGGVQLSVGNLSLRLARSQFDELSELLRVGSRRLAELEAEGVLASPERALAPTH